MPDERTPLLRSSSEDSVDVETEDLHTQFCRLIGTRPLNLPTTQKHHPHPESLYARAVSHRRNQNYTYMFTATLSNTLILSQVVLGAALTGLGASNSSHILVTIFGALNTVIAGVIAFLKSRGQPMRARMFRDDLERVVDEIENSAIMWLGISRRLHGYDAIDVDDQVTVRGEVARLTRLYDKAVKTSTLNDPDTYSYGGASDPHSAALRDKSLIAVAAPAPAASAIADATAQAPAPTPAPAPVVPDTDASPATKPPEPAKPTEAAGPSKDASVADPTDTATSRDDNGTKSDPPKTSDVTNTDSTPKDSQPAPKSEPAAPQAPTPAPAPAPAPALAPPPMNPDDSPASSAFVGKHSDNTARSPQ